MLKSERFVLPSDASFYAPAQPAAQPWQRRAHRQGPARDRRGQHHQAARDVFQDISFNSNKLGDEQQKNDILRHLPEDFVKPERTCAPAASVSST